MGRLDEAEYAYQQVLKTSPRHADGRKRLARLYHHRAVSAISGAVDTALDQARLALEFTPDDDLLQASVNDLEALASGKREKKEVLLEWGQRAAQKENWQDAADLLEAYQRLQGKEEDQVASLTDIHRRAREEQLTNLHKQADRMERLGDYDEALLALNKYLSLEPEDADQIPRRIQQLKEARKQAQLKEGKGESKPFWKNPLAWAGFAVIAIFAILLAIPTSPLRLALAPSASAEQVTERVVMATSEPTIAPTPSPTPLPYKWTRVVSTQFLERDYIQSVAIHPFDADIIYAGTRTAGLYKTNDGGISWLPINDGITGQFIQQIIIDPQNPDVLYICVHLLGVFKTEDGGDTWHRLNIENLKRDPNYQWWATVTHLAMDPSDTTHLAYTDGNGVWESRNSGESWLQLEIPFSNPNLVGIVPESGNLIVATGELWTKEIARIYLSDSLRTNWLLTNETQPIQEIMSPLLEYNRFKNEFILTCNPWEGFRSTDGGQSWEEVDGESNLAISSEGIYYSAGMGAHVVRISSIGDDQEVNKRITNTNSDVQSIAIAPSNSDRIVVVGEGIWVTDNGGDKWYERVSGLGAV